MIHRFETFRKDTGIVALQSLKVSHLSVKKFHESPKLEDWMHELYTFSQIRLHL